MADTFDMATLVAELKRDEGVRLRPYFDTVGKTTIGVGRNLADGGISQSECELLLQNDIARTIRWLDRNLPWWRALNAVRQRVLIHMAFNLGGNLLTFINTLAAIQHSDYEAAANEMLASKWATQVGQRALRLANAMRTGKI